MVVSFVGRNFHRKSGVMSESRCYFFLHYAQQVPPLQKVGVRVPSVSYAYGRDVFKENKVLYTE